MKLPKDGSYLRREIWHTLFALAVTMVVSMAIAVQGTETFDKAALIGILTTGARSLATAIVTIGSRYVIR